VLEHEIVNLIISSGIGLGTYRTREEMEAADVELFRKTMGTLKGRDQMIAELDRAIEFFGEIDAKLAPFTLKMVEKFGLLDKIEEAAQEAKESREFGEPLPALS
jgi:hypothetical protein